MRVVSNKFHKDMWVIDPKFGDLEQIAFLRKAEKMHAAFLGEGVYVQYLENCDDDDNLVGEARIDCICGHMVTVPVPDFELGSGCCGMCGREYEVAYSDGEAVANYAVGGERAKR